MTPVTATPSASTAGIRSCRGAQITVADTATSRVSSPPITPCDAGVLLRGAALPLMYRACLALIARRSRDGLAAPCSIGACMSTQRHKGAAYHLAESRCNGQGRLANSENAKTAALYAAFSLVTGG